jgi:hypothetical protein
LPVFRFGSCAQLPSACSQASQSQALWARFVRSEVTGVFEERIYQQAGCDESSLFVVLGGLRCGQCNYLGNQSPTDSFAFDCDTAPHAR